MYMHITCNLDYLCFSKDLIPLLRMKALYYSTELANYSSVVVVGKFHILAESFNSVARLPFDLTHS